MYARAIGSLIYHYMHKTRHRTFNGNHERNIGIGKEHQMAIRRLFMYLEGTNDNALCYEDHDNIFYLHAIVDIDWARDVDKIKFSRTCLFTLFKGLVRWMST